MFSPSVNRALQLIERTINDGIERMDNEIREEMRGKEKEESSHSDSDEESHVQSYKKEDSDGILIGKAVVLWHALKPGNFTIFIKSLHCVIAAVHM